MKEATAAYIAGVICGGVAAAALTLLYVDWRSRR